MRKRLLSGILAFAMILTTFLSNVTVIAAAGENEAKIGFCNDYFHIGSFLSLLHDKRRRAEQSHIIRVQLGNTEELNALEGLRHTIVLNLCKQRFHISR